MGVARAFRRRVKRPAQVPGTKDGKHFHQPGLPGQSYVETCEAHLAYGLLSAETHCQVKARKHEQSRHFQPRFDTVDSNERKGSPRGCRPNSCPTSGCQPRRQPGKRLYTVLNGSIWHKMAEELLSVGHLRLELVVAGVPMLRRASSPWKRSCRIHFQVLGGRHVKMITIVWSTGSLSPSMCDRASAQIAELNNKKVEILRKEDA